VASELLDEATTDLAVDTAADAVDAMPDTADTIDPVDRISGDVEETASVPLGTYDCLISPDCHRIIVVAHRGLHEVYPENSLAALRAAAQAGIPIAELDVRHTLDGELVLMHDDTLDRTTNGSGRVEDFTLAEIQQLVLKKGVQTEPESLFVPTFQQALELARETGLVLYVDQKTHRWDLVLAAVAGGNYYDVAMIRDGLGTIELMAGEDPALFVMPAVEGVLLLEGALSTIPHLRIVELSQGDADPEFGIYAHQRNIKVQQDVMVCDLFAITGDYNYWKSYIDAGVDVLQSDLPHILNPLVDHYNETGEW